MRYFLIPLSLVLLLIFTLPSPVVASDDEQAFGACIEGLKDVARRQNLSEPLVSDVLGSLQHQPRVIELDRDQPEFRQSFSAYLSARVNDYRVRRGRELYRQHDELLDRLSSDYGVPGHYLVAFWGMETNFGSYLGAMPTLDSLATLACDPRRSAYFTDELMTALQLLARENLDPSSMRGSWAGAMGHMQFMPSSYLAHAVDGDGDGAIDLWNSVTDALTSAANYLANIGWQRGERWGREVRLPAGFPYIESGRSNTAALAHWRALGVRQTDGSALPQVDMLGSVIVPMGHRGPAFLVYANFDVVMEWNRSQAYAIAVGHLADRIAGGGGLAAPLPDVENAPSRRQILALQRGLIQAGFDPGEPDGILGPATRAAVRGWQAANGRIADGYPDPATLTSVSSDPSEPERHNDQ